MWYDPPMTKLPWVFALLVACGGSKPAPVTSTEPTIPNANMVAPADAVLAIADLKFYMGDQMGLHLHGDGRLEAQAMSNGVSGWHDVATFKPDGTITTPDGKVGGQVQADGSLKSATGEVAPFKLDGEALVVADKRVTIDDKGVFVMDGKMPQPALRVEGATDAKTRRTALLIMALVMGAEPHPDGPPPPATKTP